MASYNILIEKNFLKKYPYVELDFLIQIYISTKLQETFKKKDVFGLTIIAPFQNGLEKEIHSNYFSLGEEYRSLEDMILFCLAEVGNEAMKHYFPNDFQVSYLEFLQFLIPSISRYMYSISKDPEFRDKSIKFTFYPIDSRRMEKGVVIALYYENLYTNDTENKVNIVPWDIQWGFPEDIIVLNEEMFKDLIPSRDIYVFLEGRKYEMTILEKQEKRVKSKTES